MSTQEADASVPGAEGNADGFSADSATSSTSDTSQGLREARDRYRTERDAAREEVAEARARIEQMQRAEIERLAGEHLAVGADLFMNGNDLTSYLTEDGFVDSDRVREDSQLLTDERPGLRKNPPAFDPSQGTGGSKPKQSTPSWGVLFQ
ncbi:hypothetical protein AB0J79_18650 [Rhodococcus coprophilus]|uniref:hypothetical protein n=1 Tax=Rhodococcus coprophilus TaxID=38310 RepID=UPI00342130C8